jgi:hypothetical protein
MPAQQAEGSTLLVGQWPIRPLERRPHREVFSRKRIQGRSPVRKAYGYIGEQLTFVVA